MTNEDAYLMQIMGNVSALFSLASGESTNLSFVEVLVGGILLLSLWLRFKRLLGI